MPGTAVFCENLVDI